MSLTARELIWLHRMMNSDDPVVREFAWAYYLVKREAQLKK